MTYTPPHPRHRGAMLFLSPMPWGRGWARGRIMPEKELVRTVGLEPTRACAQEILSTKNNVILGLKA